MPYHPSEDVITFTVASAFNDLTEFTNEIELRSGHKLTLDELSMLTGGSYFDLKRDDRKRRLDTSSSHDARNTHRPIYDPLI